MTKKLKIKFGCICYINKKYPNVKINYKNILKINFIKKKVLFLIPTHTHTQFLKTKIMVFHFFMHILLTYILNYFYFLSFILKMLYTGILFITKE